MAIDPALLPPAVGAKETDRVTLSDGLTVVGVATPLVVRPAPTVVTAEILTAAFPVFVKRICLSAELPVATVPKLRLVGLAVSWPVALEFPVPLRRTLVVGLAGSLLVMLKFPVALPTAVGEKVTRT
jgi:hypothetical protein